MNQVKTLIILALTGLWLGACATTGMESQPADPLPSWNEGGTRTAILSFVEAVTDPGGEAYVPPEARIAVFDNDGTLWAEKPFYYQFVFAMDRIRDMAPDHPEWQDTQPFKAVLDNDMAALMATGEAGLAQLLTTAFGGMTTTEFPGIVLDWDAAARHPRFDVPYTSMVYQPMLELLDYLRDNGFQTWIVSGGGVSFMRPWTESAYGIPPEQVVGSSLALKFDMRESGPVILREAQVNFINDKQGKPVGIQQHIGRRPIAAFGNSDGDLQMLQWTAAGDGRSLMVYIHHTDAVREWAYDRDSLVGRLDEGLKVAAKEGWTVTDMKKDWKVVFPFESGD